MVLSKHACLGLTSCYVGRKRPKKAAAIGRPGRYGNPDFITALSYIEITESHGDFFNSSVTCGEIISLIPGIDPCAVAFG
jgi:hypothetical protein